jgi:hypothetical protein
VTQCGRVNKREIVGAEMIRDADLTNWAMWMDLATLEIDLPLVRGLRSDICPELCSIIEIWNSSLKNCGALHLISFHLYFWRFDHVVHCMFLYTHVYV